MGSASVWPWTGSTLPEVSVMPSTMVEPDAGVTISEAVFDPPTNVDR